MVTARVDSTWGIRESAFVASYCVTLVVVATVAVLTRYRPMARRRADRMAAPTAAQSALIVEGPTRAVMTSVAALRFAGVISVRSTGALVAVGPLMADTSRLDVAVYHASVRGLRLRDVLADRQVTQALAQMQAAVRAAGWMLTDAERRRAGAGAWLLLILALVGWARTFVVLLAGGAMGWLPLLATVAAIGAGVLRKPPRVSRAGDRAIAAQRRIHGHLAPGLRPAWTTYGFLGLAWGVALFGTTALWSADPAFAAAAGLSRPLGYGGTARAGEFSGCGRGCGGDRTCGGGGEGCGD